MQETIRKLSDKILRLQGDGNYAETSAWIEQQGKIGQQLRADLERLERRHIPVDIVLEQGVSVLGLNP